MKLTESGIVLLVIGVLIFGSGLLMTAGGVSSLSEVVTEDSTPPEILWSYPNGTEDNPTTLKAGDVINPRIVPTERLDTAYMIVGGERYNLTFDGQNYDIEEWTVPEDLYKTVTFEWHAIDYAGNETVKKVYAYVEGGTPPEPPKHTVTTSAVNGDIVRVNEYRPTSSSMEVVENTMIKLEAIPKDGYEFTQWSGDVSGTSNPVKLLVDSDKYVTAHFTEVEEPPTPPETYEINTYTEGSGSGTIQLTPDKAEYEEGTEVTLNALSADNGSVFKEWTGDISGSSKSKTITVESDMSIGAVFEKREKYTLTVLANPKEGGSVNLTQADKITVTHPKTVRLQAFPNEGYNFEKWTGDVKGISKQMKVFLDSDMTVTANFKEEPSLIDKLSSNLNYVLLAVGSVVLVAGVMRCDWT